jgi:hypothetical protein
VLSCHLYIFGERSVEIFFSNFTWLLGFFLSFENSLNILDMSFLSDTGFQMFLLFYSLSLYPLSAISQKAEDFHFDMVTLVNLCVCV